MTKKQLYSKVLHALCLIGVVRAATASASLPANDNDMRPIQVVSLQTVIGVNDHAIDRAKTAVSVNELIEAGIVVAGRPMVMSASVPVKDLEVAGAIRQTPNGYTAGQAVSLDELISAGKVRVAGMPMIRS